MFYIVLEVLGLLYIINNYIYIIYYDLIMSFLFLIFYLKAFIYLVFYYNLISNLLK